MSDDESFEPKLGSVSWRDLTVPDGGTICVIEDPAGAVAALYSVS